MQARCSARCRPMPKTAVRWSLRQYSTQNSSPNKPEQSDKVAQKTLKPSDPNYESRIRTSFTKQTAMKTFQAEMRRISPGEVEIEMPYSNALSQQNGFIHGGVITAIVDSACGYAAYTLMPADVDVLSVEFKINFVSPAAGRLFRAYGYVLKPGKTITATRGEVWSVKEDGSKDKLVAAMQATMIVVRGASS